MTTLVTGAEVPEVRPRQNRVSISPVDRGKFPRAGALEEKIQVDGIFHGIFLVMAFLDGFWRCFFAISRPVAMVEAMWWNAATGGV